MIPFLAVLGLLILAGALMVVMSKNTVTSAVMLVLVMLAVALMEGLIGAHLMAALQVLVYAGAIMVLFVFVIMLINPDWSEDHPIWWSRKRWLVPTLVFGIVIAGMMHVFSKILPPASLLFPVMGHSAQWIEEQGGNAWVLARVLMSEWLFPVELVSLLLLAVIAGVVQLSKRKLKREREKVQGV